MLKIEHKLIEKMSRQLGYEVLFPMIGSNNIPMAVVWDHGDDCPRVVILKVYDTEYKEEDVQAIESGQPNEDGIGPVFGEPDQFFETEKGVGKDDMLDAVSTFCENVYLTKIEVAKCGNRGLVRTSIETEEDRKDED
jgi:hypothetical protein